MTTRVAVLKGGWSAEREVSLVSGEACGKALRNAGYDVTEVDLRRDLPALLGALSPRPDVVFNALHGRYGEDGCVQGLLNIIGIPYTHSGLAASAVAMDKPLAKQVFVDAGIAVAEHKIVHRASLLSHDPLPRPYVVKPLNEGSSVGVHIVRPGDNLPVAVAGDAYDLMMVERFISGRELTVAVMDDRALAVTEITTQHGFYDYDAKYAEGGSIHVIPADLHSDVYDAALRAAERAHSALGCRGVSRADFRLDGSDLYILEVNTQPGMTPTSLVPEQAVHCGMTFEELVSWMVDNASCD